MTVRDRTIIKLKIKVPSRKLSGETLQEHLWTAIRNLKRFTLQELIFAASTDTLKITEPEARRYLQRLREAEYFNITKSGVKPMREEWWLKPGMNTGPKPPMLIQVSMLWDRNNAALADQPVTEECVL